MSHPSAAAFERYVIGAMEGSEASAFEAHAGTCGSCNQALAREARVEVGLQEAARYLRSQAISSRVSRSWLAAAAIVGMGLAAAVLVVFSLQHRRLSFDAVPDEATVPVDSNDERLARNNTVSLEGLDEPMDGSDAHAMLEPIGSPAREIPRLRGSP